MTFWRGPSSNRRSRQIAAGKRVNEALDWPNIAEEIESVARSELDAVQSLDGLSSVEWV
ncbi:MAG: DUF29 family protein [Acetobacteraceae bacterium]|nr:DUF29 family protein [Acetobacteraceae bacterium]MBV8591954.1 DUF29 family protein [Acetobacteraceae bacterium]